MQRKRHLNSVLSGLEFYCL